MSDRRSYVALDWVNAQIAETLQQAQEALDGFIANPHDITKLRFGLTYLHQVTGSLVMVELQAASMLSREMENLLNAVLANEYLLQPQIEAAKLINPLLYPLTQYLDKVAKTHEDSPREILELLNSLRAANDLEPFSEADIFNPDIAIARQTEKQQPTIAAEEFNELIRKLRQSFQTGLIGIVRDKDLENNFQLVSKVCHSLLKTSANTASEPLWQIAFAIADQLAHAGKPADIESKKALKQIDSQIKHLEEAGRDALSESPDSALLKALLYSVATTETVTLAIAELRAIYNLDRALAESEAAPAEEPPASKKLVLSIIDSIRQELTLIAGFDLGDMNDALVRLQNTLRIVAVNDLLASTQAIEQDINSVVDDGSNISSRAESISAQLDIIDQFLQAWQDKKLAIDSADVALRYQDYLANLRQDLDRVKQTLADYAAENCNKALIQSLPELLDRLLELLAISPLRRLLPVIQSAYQFVVTQLLWQETPPHPLALQALADAISSIDYYLERLPADSTENLQSIIGVAIDSIDKLQKPMVELIEEDRILLSDEEVYDDNSGIMPAEHDDAEFSVNLTSTANEPIPVASIDELPPEADETTAEVAQEPQPIREADQAVAGSETTSLPGDDSVAAAEVSLVDSTADQDADELLVFEPGEDADEEILEIFIEEAREVVEHIQEYLPQLDADHENLEALLEIRRSYHTLKGSGRMVGALHIGDFAWSVERMLNNVRDGLGKVNATTMAILHMATDFVPVLIDGMEQRSGISKTQHRNIIDRANAEFEGRPFIEETTAAVTAPPETVLPEAAVSITTPESGPDTVGPDEESVDEELLAIFLAEAQTYLDVLGNYLDNIDPGYEDVKISSELQRALHTLKGSSHMAGVNCVATLVSPLEAFVKDLNNFQTTVDAEILTMLVRARELLENQLAQLEKGDTSLIAGVESYVAELKHIHAAKIEKHEIEACSEEGFADKYTALMSEALDCLSNAADLIQEWQSEDIDEGRRLDLVNCLYRLGRTAAEAHYQEVADLATALADYYQRAIQEGQTYNLRFFTLANKAHDELDDMMNIIAAHQLVDAATDLIAELQQGVAPLPAHETVTEQQKQPSKPAFVSDNSHLSELRQQALAADPDTLEIFTEEAEELLDILDALMQDWFSNHKDRSGLGEIKRIIHTIKGGARLTDINVLADITQAYEQCIDRAEASDRYDDAFFAAAQQFQNQTAFYIAYIVSGAFREEPQSDDSRPDTENAVMPTAAIADGSTPETEQTLPEITALDSAIASEFDEAFAFVLDTSGTEDSGNPGEIPQALVDDEAEFTASLAEDIGALADDATGVGEIIPAIFGEDIVAAQPEAVDGALIMAAIETAPGQEAEEPAVRSASNDYTMLAEQYRKADQETLEIFLEEAQELDAELDETASAWFADQASITYASALKRILHTLKGGARLAELSVLGNLTHNCESMIEHAELRHAFDAAFFADLQQYVDQIHQMIEFVANGARGEDIPSVVTAVMAAVTAPDDTGTEVITEIAAPVATAAEPVAETEEQPADQLADQPRQDNILQALAEQYHKADQDTLEIFLEEAIELDASLETAVADWLADREASGHADALKRILHTLKGGARLAELAVLGDLTHNFESMIEHAEARRAFDDAFFAHMQQYHDQIHRLVEFISNGAKTSDMAIAVSALEPILASVGEVSEPVELSARLVTDTAPLISAADDIDSELLALFVEEAKEQSEGIEECIANFLKDPADIAPLDELKRLLHTLKGGARLTGVRAIGDMSHDFETFIINSEREKKVNAGAFVDEMQAFHDRLAKMIASINVTASPRAEDSHKAESNVVPIRPGINVANNNAALVSQAAIDATRAFIDNFNKDQQRSNREPVKITPDLLEDLINLAGEGSISRSRIEEQMNEIIISQVEMDATVDRLHNQLRRLEIETEAQIVFRQEQVVSEGQENFDPLEMDRYTHMQQLSKSLIESASDLDDISATFTNKMRDMETLLLQQARINTELQEGLMRCQMVPFSRMVPRLRRIVRQVAQELGKKVEFEVENAEGELDRTILERMVAPLEHMLRNAVDHGIEMPDVRKAAGKPQQGTIVLALSREGGEIVLTLRDDGAGVNIAAVRKKAIERGLMTEDATLSDHELSQFILHAGFSTAQKITQISGRGVGMDVVHSEIKQMGGSLDINSKQGQGSVFTVRLPFTVSVNRALMVVVGSDTYAIPLNTIEGIVRVSPYELEAYYQPDAPMFEYAGQSYHLRYMGSLLHRGHRAKLEGLTTPLPVVLIRSSDYTVAVQVDKLLGSREVVVKSLGPQFSMVGGLSGATVLGDGSVVIILDMLSLIRADFALGLSQSAGRTEEYVPEPVRKITTVMVVDDSVTVRKVTSRLLERFGMNVILAKDGLDALTQLQEMDTLPDVMLLDIEMPRMDGFEVVSRVRHDIRLQHIPITMITSRTGEKHRERAIALGATRYLGKPFQERELLQTISELTGADIQQA